MHGQGTLRWASGERYDGEWIEGEEDGLGVFTWRDGTTYDGFWQSGKKHGIGVCASASPCNRACVQLLCLQCWNALSSQCLVRSHGDIARVSKLAKHVAKRLCCLFKVHACLFMEQQDSHLQSDCRCTALCSQMPSGRPVLLHCRGSLSSRRKSQLIQSLQSLRRPWPAQVAPHLL